MGEFNKKLFILSLLVLVVGVCLYRFPSDDGLRHVGMAFADAKSWGDVYPRSIFERLRDYDPWFGYDYGLRGVASWLKLLPLPEPVIKFLMVKGISFLFLCTFFYLVLARSGILEKIKDRETFTVAYMIVIVLLVQPFLRIMIIRPFAFGTFFLVYAVGRRGVVRGAVSSAVLTFFYPYLAWFYTLPTAFAHVVKGDKRFALGLMAVTGVFLYFQPPSFWRFQIALFQSDTVRQAMDTKIGEFGFTLGAMAPYLYGAGLLVLLPLFSKDVKKLTYTNLLLIVYLLPALKYIRYFIDLTLPLLFISFGSETLRALTAPYAKIVSHWRETAKTVASGLKFRAKPKTVPAGSSGNGKSEAVRTINLKPYIVLLYIFVLAVFIYRNCEKYSSLEAFRAGLSVIPAGSLVLTDFSLQYKTLYTRPDLRLIPSCELGFAEDGIKKEYVDFFNKGDVSPLARKTGANFFMESGEMYINPLEGRHMTLAEDGRGLKIWRFTGSEKRKKVAAW